MLPDIQPGNTKILYFFNCLLDGMHTIIFLLGHLSLHELNSNSFSSVEIIASAKNPIIIPAYPVIQNKLTPCPAIVPVIKVNAAAPITKASTAQNIVFKNKNIFSFFHPAAL